MQCGVRTLNGIRGCSVESEVNFEPFELDEATGEKISPANVDHLYLYLDPLWDQLGESDNAKEYSGIIAKLVFHARHLTPLDHAILARFIALGFKLPPHRPENIKRMNEILEKMRPFFGHYEWKCLTRAERVREIMKLYKKSQEGAESIYDKAEVEYKWRYGEDAPRKRGRKSVT
jgi:hypothetical protein